jgi:hypothetical protein
VEKGSPDSLLHNQTETTVADDPYFKDESELDKTVDKAAEGRKPNAAQRTEAHRLVDYWGGKATGASWPTLNKNQVINGLHARIESPNQIDQLNTNMCGVAAFVRELAYDDPVQYGLLGALLYEGGWGNLGRRRLKRIEPRLPTRMEQVPKRGDGRLMNHADWLVLASIRDAFNSFAYVHDVFERLRGMTSVEMPRFFQAAGYTNITYDWDAITPKGVENMEKASQLFRNDYAVALLIHSKMLEPDSTRYTPTSNHWVVLRSPIFLNYAWKPGQVGVRIEKIWTWGTEKTIPSGYKECMPLTEFMGYYYGYVAAKAEV